MSTPFSHESLEVKKRFLELARKYHELSNKEDDDEIKLAYELSAALLYMNMADYLAQHLAYGLNDLANESVAQFYHGVISIKTKNKLDKDIKSSINLIDTYEFPRKQDVMSALGRVKSARNKVAHSIFKVKPEELVTIDEAITSLKDSTEILITLVDQIQLGMPPRSMMDALVAGEPK